MSCTDKLVAKGRNRKKIITTIITFRSIEKNDKSNQKWETMKKGGEEVDSDKREREAEREEMKPNN